MSNWAEGASKERYTDRIVEHERLRRYRAVGIDPLNPNPDGSDHHIMDAIDDEMALPYVWPEQLPKDEGFILHLKREIASVEAGLRKTDWDETRLPAMKQMLATYEGRPA